MTNPDEAELDELVRDIAFLKYEALDDAEAKARLLAYIEKRESQRLQKILDNGHGGGNFRRLILQELAVLRQTEADGHE